ncbi:MAG: TonB family protein [Pseudomonadota bacterium]
MITIRARHWGVALFLAISVHIGFLGFFWEPSESGAESIGLGGLEIALGAAGGSPGAVPQNEATDVELVEGLVAAEADVVSEPADIVRPNDAIDLLPAEVREAYDGKAVPPSNAAPNAPLETPSARAVGPMDVAEVAPLGLESNSDVIEVPALAPVLAPVLAPGLGEFAEDIKGVNLPQGFLREDSALLRPLNSITKGLDLNTIVADVAPQEVQTLDATIQEPVLQGVNETPAPVLNEASTRNIPPLPKSKPETQLAVAAAADIKPKNDTATSPATESQAKQRGPTSDAGSAGASGNQANEGAGVGNSTSGGGRPGAARDYASIIQAWLESHKKYPSRAKRRRLEGIAYLYFSIDRDGQLLDYRIHATSGHELLDREVQAMIERAAPLPPMPDDLDGQGLELVVPVQFRLQ